MIRRINEGMMSNQMKNDHRGNKELQERWLLRTNNLDSEAEDWFWIKRRIGGELNGKQLKDLSEEWF